MAARRSGKVLPLPLRGDQLALPSFGHLAPEPAPAAVLRPDVTWQQVLRSYLDAALDRPNTRFAYSRAVNLCLGKLGIVSLGELRGEMLATWRAAVLQSSWALASKQQHLAAIRSFLKWARTMGAHRLTPEVIDAALRSPRGETRRPPTYLTEDELGAVLAAADHPRDRAFLALLAAGGLRVSEACGLEGSHLYRDDSGGLVAHLVEPKYGVDAHVPLPESVAGLLTAWRRSVGQQLLAPGPVFFRLDQAGEAHLSPQYRRPLTRSAAEDLVRQVVKRAGLAKHISPHAFRHTAAMRTLRASHNVVAVQKLLRHRSLSTTQRYLDHLQLDELRAAIPELPL